jgi:hypothetical protein
MFKPLNGDPQPPSWYPICEVGCLDPKNGLVLTFTRKEIAWKGLITWSVPFSCLSNVVLRGVLG